MPGTYSRPAEPMPFTRPNLAPLRADPFRSLRSVDRRRACGPSARRRVLGEQVGRQPDQVDMAVGGDDVVFHGRVPPGESSSRPGRRASPFASFRENALRPPGDSLARVAHERDHPLIFRAGLARPFCRRPEERRCRRRRRPVRRRRLLARSRFLHLEHRDPRGPRGDRRHAEGAARRRAARRVRARRPRRLVHLRDGAGPRHAAMSG